MNRSDPSCPCRRCAARLIVVCLCTIIALPITAHAAQDAPPTGEPARDVPTMAEAGALLQAGELEAARDAFTAIVQDQPDHAAAWFQLGFARISLNENDAAIDAFEQALEHGFQPGPTMYNLACAYGKQDNIDQSLRWLREAFNHGFENYELIRLDGDLHSVRADPRYKELVADYTTPYQRPEQAQAVTFTATDGLTVHGDLYETSAARTAPLILLFHQGGSNKAEYFPIAPRLVEMGFHCLAIDARAGTSRFGHLNDTAEGFIGQPTFLGAYVDLEAALHYAREQGFTGPIIVWGSSYSGGLVLRLAADYPDDVIATLSFSIPSPGNRFMDGDAYQPVQWANASRAMMFITLPPREMNDEKQVMFDAVEKEQKFLHTQEHGVHGSSTLHDTRNPDGAEANWRAVGQFLQRVLLQP